MSQFRHMYIKFHSLNKDFRDPRLFASTSPIANTLLAVAISLRPYQWTKNSLVFGGLIFSRSLLQMEAVWMSLGAFVIFCLASSSIYLLNDLRDLEDDRQHPVKRFRPLAAGELSPALAMVTMVLLFIGSLSSAWTLRPAFGIILSFYISMNVAYSFGLKKLVILDVVLVALGFVLRALAGAIVIGVQASPWLILCTLMLAILVGFGKRRHELTLLLAKAHNHRQNLEEYTIPFLDMLMSISSGGAVITYALYTMAEETVARLGTHALVLSTPCVLYGIFRYLYLVHQGKNGGDPALLFINDRPTLMNVGLWVILVCFVIYIAPQWLSW